MAYRMGLLGKKIGMSQAFDAAGDWSAFTVVEMGPCTVLDIKNVERDGYSALQLGFGEKRLQRVNRADAGLFAKAKTTPKKFVREIRLTPDEVAQFSIGQTLTVDQVFKPGDVVDICGTSIGKGFQGVMKRHHFKGYRATHGTHEYFRHGGSLGCRLTPGRVFKGRKMPGQMGNQRVTVQNIRVKRVISEKNLLLLGGAVPGAEEGNVIIKHAVKRSGSSFKLPQASTPAAPVAE